MTDLRSMFERDPSTRVPERTKTEDKLQEANYFRNRLKDVGGKKDEFRWNLTAFISAARSVTYIMQKEYRHRKGFWNWYELKQEEMKADPLLRFIHDKRNEILHFGIVQVYGCHRSEVVDIHVIAPVEQAISVAVTAVEANKAEDSAPAVEGTTPQPSRKARGFVWTFRKFPKRDVMSVVEEALTKLERLVGECNQKFGKKPGSAS